MRSFIPHFSRIRPQGKPGLTPKLGGLPWGLPLALWPTCRECGEPMTMVAQLPVRGGLDHVELLRARSDLMGQVLHIFKCERDSICNFWEAEDGANAAFFVPESELGTGEVAPPEPTPPILPDVWIEGWTPYDDVISNEQAAMFLDEEAYWKLPEEVAAPHDNDCDYATKIGGVPFWTGNGPMRIPDASFQYILQIDQILHVTGGDEDYLTFGNFCSDGTGFLFVDLENKDLPCRFFINR